MGDSELYKELFIQAEQKREGNDIVGSISDNQKMIFLLRGESVRSSGGDSFYENVLLENESFERINELSKSLPLEDTILKLANIKGKQNFPISSLDFGNIINHTLSDIKPLSTPILSQPPRIPSNAPMLSLLNKEKSIEEDRQSPPEKRRTKNFNYNRSQSNGNRESSTSHRRQDEDEEDLEHFMEQKKSSNPFKTAKQKMRDDKREKNKRSGGREPPYNNSSSLGGKRRFNPAQSLRDNTCLGGKKQKQQIEEEEEEEKHPIFDDPRMEKIEERMANMILSEILVDNVKVGWKDIAGLEKAKKSVMEIVVYPLWRPELFHGIRRPAKGLLLFGPPGTGKTMIGKAIASEAGATFFNISASSLTSKYVGEGEKMVRALFTVARCYPSDMKVIFIDEVDSLLTQRSENDQEASRRIKTEFLVQMDGAGNDPSERILVVGATNRPQEIDEAARRRFMTRLYIPLPSKVGRRKMVSNLLIGQKHSITEEELDNIALRTLGYSGSDIAGLCSEAAFGPIRLLGEGIRNIAASEVRPISMEDFNDALKGIRASVSNKDLELYKEWNGQFGSFGDPPPID